MSAQNKQIMELRVAINNGNPEVVRRLLTTYHFTATALDIALNLCISLVNNHQIMFEVMDIILSVRNNLVSFTVRNIAMAYFLCELCYNKNIKPVLDWIYEKKLINEYDARECCEIASCHGSLEMFEWTLVKDPTKITAWESFLESACTNSDFELVKKICNTSNINTKNMSYGMLSALLSVNDEIAEWLYENGARFGHISQQDMRDFLVNMVEAEIMDYIYKFDKNNEVDYTFLFGVLCEKKLFDAAKELYKNKSKYIELDKVLKEYNDVEELQEKMREIIFGDVS